MKQNEEYRLNVYGSIYYVQKKNKGIFFDSWETVFYTHAFPTAQEVLKKFRNGEYLN